MLGDTGPAASRAGGDVPVEEPYAAGAEVDGGRRGEDDGAPGAGGPSELWVGDGRQVERQQRSRYDRPLCVLRVTVHVHAATLRRVRVR